MLCVGSCGGVIASAGWSVSHSEVCCGNAQTCICLQVLQCRRLFQTHRPVGSVLWVTIRFVARFIGSVLSVWNMFCRCKEFCRWWISEEKAIKNHSQFVFSNRSRLAGETSSNRVGTSSETTTCPTLNPVFILKLGDLLVVP